MAKETFTLRSDGRYMCRVFIGTDENGKKKYKNIYGKTQKEVKKKRDEAISKLSRGLDLSAQKDTFKFWADKFLEGKRATVSERSALGIECNLKHFSDLYDMPISKILPHHIEDILKELATRPKKPLAKKTLTDLRNVAFGVFRLAIKNRVMDFNPASVVDIPTGSGRTKRESITDEQIRWINETSHNAQTAAMIMLYSGLRRGELVALTWNDIDFKNKTIRVNKAVEYINNTPIVKNMTKTQAGMRLISIPDVLVKYLMTVKCTSIIVCTTNGKMMTEGCFRRMWESYMNKLNEEYGNFGRNTEAKKKNGEKKSRFAPGGLPMVIDTFTPHQLRHTYASMLYKAGIDVLTAKDQLGHSDIKTTLNIYTHLDSIYKTHSMNKLNDYITRTG